MKDEELKGMPVKVKDPKDGTVYEGFVAHCEREKGLTVKLLDPEKAHPKWKKLPDGSVNLLCMRAEDRNNPNALYFYDPCFDHFTKAIKEGRVIEIGEFLSMPGLHIEPLPIKPKQAQARCAFE